MRALLAIACAALVLVSTSVQVEAQPTLGAPAISSVTAGTNDLTVVWTAPAEDGGATITSYDLRYIPTAADETVDDNWTIDEGIWSSGTLSYTLAGLHDGTGYGVQVRADNGGDGPWSATSTGTTADHGGTPTTATTVTLGSSTPGRINVAGDVDYFQIQVSTDTDLWAYTTGAIDTVGQVFDDMGTRLARSDNGIILGGPLNFSIRLDLSPGTYYIRAAHASDSATGTYALHTQAVPEPGITRETAQEITLDAMTPGRVGPGGSADGNQALFKLVLTEATDFWVLSLSMDIRLQIWLHDSEGNRIDYSYDADPLSHLLAPAGAGFWGRTIGNKFGPLAAGTYYIAVNRFADHTPIPWGHYTLYVQSVGDPGTSMESATPLSFLDPRTGRILSAPGTHYFQLTVPEENYIGIELLHFATGETLRAEPLRVTVFDQGVERQLFTVPRAAFLLSGEGHEMNTWLWGLLGAGTYHIKVEAASGAGPGLYMIHAYEDVSYRQRVERCTGLNTPMSDPWYGCQWTLSNTNQFGAGGGQDINVEEVWSTNKGEGIHIAVVDDGLDYSHEDLTGNVLQARNHDYGGNGDVFEPLEAHGTKVAGIIVAQENSLGVRGVAPEATLYTYDLIDANRLNDDDVADSAIRHLQHTAVVNNSWGQGSSAAPKPATASWEAAVRRGVEHGFGGKGIFYVWSGGNGGLTKAPSNLDEIKNYFAVTAVCAVNYEDERASYSSSGSNLWVCAPSGALAATRPRITTTEPGSRYTGTFGGTSAATPIVSGVAALVRAANPNLTWRDVKLILATSARKNHASNTGWQEGALKYGSATDRYSFNHEYGFGVVDAGAAVTLAGTWTNLPGIVEYEVTSDDTDMDIPDLESGSPPTAVESTVTLAPLVEFVEFVELNVDWDHASIRDLQIELESPSGAVSSMAPAHASRRGIAWRTRFRFGSSRHLGEDAAGSWTLRITDTLAGHGGSVRSWSLKVYGHRSTPTAPTLDYVAAGGESLTVAWTAPTNTVASDITAYDVRHIRSDATDKSDSEWVVADNAWTSGDLEYTIGGLTGSVQYDVQVRAVTAKGDGVWSATEVSTPTTDKAPTIDSWTPGERSVAVEWNTPTNASLGTITSYDLRYIRSDASNKADADWTEITGIWTSGTLEYTLNPTAIPLVNGVSYDVQVRARVGTDEHAWSGTRSATPRTTPGAPTIDTVAGGDGSLAVEWSEPASDGGNDITSYDLQYIETSEDETVEANWDVETGVWSTRDFESDLTGLDTGTQYDVQVRAVNDAGAGGWSATRVGTTRPGAPVIDSLTGVAGGLTVEWSAPATDGDAMVTSYDLRYIRTNADEAVASNWTIRTGVWRSVNLTATVTRLEVGTRYDVQMRAVNASGEGPWSSTRMATTAHAASLWPIEPRVGAVLRATVDDLDRNVGSLGWQWTRSADTSAWTSIPGRGDSYTPEAGDVGMYIRASASWMDGGGVGQTARVVSAHAVGTREDSPDITVVELVSGLTIPWDIAFTPDGAMLFTQLSGVLSSRLGGGAVQTVSADFSDLAARGTKGLMGIVVDPDFASNRRFYTCQGHTGPEVQVIAWTINAAYTTATRVGDPLVGDLPANNPGFHAGCRLRFGPDGYLWIATGDAYRVGNAQDLDSLGGKVLRVDASTGAAAPGNPFGSPVYASGHRNPQGLALRPGMRQMWLVDHGPDWDDEINLLTAGGNYGWDPVLAGMPNVYTEQVPMTDLVKFPDAIEARWSSGERTLATSGGIFLAGADWEEWDGRLAVGTLVASELYVFEFTASGTFVSQVVVPELDGVYGRLRTPMLGPEGALYVTTSDGGGRDRILKVAPSLPPSFASETDEQEVTENNSASTVVATVTATDPEHQTLTYALSGPDAASFTIPNSAAGQLRARAPLDHEDATSHEVIVTASDPYGLSDSITLTINVTDIDEPPEITLAASPGVSADDNELSVDEHHDGTVATFTASDPERKPGLTYGWSVGGTDRLDFTITAAGALSFVNIPDHERPADSGGNNVYNITVSALDSDGKRGNIAIAVTVEPVNERPAITGDAAPSIEEGRTRLVGTYQASDPESATIAWQPLGGSDSDKFDFTSSNGRLAFKVAPDYEDATDSGRNNVYDVMLSVSAGGHTTTLDVAVSVTNKDEGGALGFSSPQPQADAGYTATLSDPDGVVTTAWTWERSTSRNGPWASVTGAIDRRTTSVYTPTAGDVGYYLRASAAYMDGHGPNKGRVLVSANSVKTAPVANVPPSFSDRTPTRSIPENARALASVGRPVAATDLNSGDVLTYELAGSDIFTIDSSSGQIQVAADESLDHETAPSHSVTVKASDTSNAFDTVPVTITVDDVNEPPDAAPDAPDSFDEDTAVTIDVLANDSDTEDDGSELLLTVFNSGPNAPRNGTVRVNEPANAREKRTITYEPSADYHGSDTFTYRVTDTGSPPLSSTATVSIEVDAVNDSPMFASPTTTRSVSERAKAGGKVGSPVTAMDVDEGDTLTYSLFGIDARFFDIGRRSAQITVGGGVTLDIATKDTYTAMVDADDGNGRRATVEVTITVTTGPVGSPIIVGGGGGGGGPSGPTPSEVDFEWNVTRDIDELDGGHDMPTGMWANGQTLWLAENGDGSDDAVYAYDIESGERLEDREFDLDERNRAPRGLWSDRESVWVSDSGQNKLFAHDLETGERLPDSDIALASRNRDARGIWSGDSIMWVLDGGKNALFGYDLGSGELLGEYELDAANSDPRGIWSDGVTVWVSDHGAKRLFAYRLEEGEDGADELEQSRDEEFPSTVLSRASNNSPRGIWSDGDVMYVADESDAKVYSYNMPDAIDARLASLTLSGVEIGEFEPGRTDYEGAPGEGVTETIVEALAVESGAEVAIDPPDADEEADGHQVALEGLSEIAVAVTSADGSRERVYRVRLRELAEAAANEPTFDCFRGDIAAGFSLVVYGGGSIEDLEACAESRHITALYALEGGAFVSYILGAPAFVNAPFGELYAGGLPALTVLTAKSDGPPTADPVPGSLEGVTPSWPECLRGDIAEGFSHVLYEGGSVEDLEECARNLDVAALYALEGGGFVSYIIGAPAFVNEDFATTFAEGLLALTPLVARSDEPLAQGDGDGETAGN